jgi:hypothetical protein
MARAFLGYDGGYSIRKLKKFMKREKDAIKAEKEESRKRYDARKLEEEAAADVEAPAEEGAAGTAPGDEYSDESDLDEAL